MDASTTQPPGPRSIPLPVLNAPPPAGHPARFARARAAVMIGIHLLITAHLLHWGLTGRSLNRFVLSDAMETIETGRVNPGFLLFAAALATTALFGRFLCGWACHMAGLQDLCAWLLRRAGIRPHLFRSRLLGYFPLLLALNLFVWPTAKRLLASLLDGPWPAAAAWLNPAPPPDPLSLHLTTDDLWSGMPGPLVAIPFLLLCGFATVYFLGARGLCRYGCPYGGFLRIAARAAPVRVIVDWDRCNQCGLCTAACTAGVRVHDEVRAFRMVTSQDCVRSLDCVAACPQQALRLGRRSSLPPAPDPPPPPPRQRHDLTLREELFVGGVCAAAFLSIRGIYGVIPMLMAATIAVLAAYVAWKALRSLIDRDVRLARVQLRRAGRLRPAGWAFLLLTTVGAALLAQCAAVHLLLRRADRLDLLVTVPADVVFRGDVTSVPAEQRELAGRAIRAYTLASGWRHGGIGLTDTPAACIRLAWLHLVRGELPQAEAWLRSALCSEPHNDHISASLARALLLQGRPTDAEALLQSLCDRERPKAPECRDLLARLLAGQGRIDDAKALYLQALGRDDRDVRARTGLGDLLAAVGDLPDALVQFTLAAETEPRQVIPAHRAAIAAAMLGRIDEARDWLERAYERCPRDRASTCRLAVRLTTELGLREDADRWSQRLSSKSTRTRR